MVAKKCILFVIYYYGGGDCIERTNPSY